MQKDLLLPASILAGCTIIGAGLFLGLRASQPPPVGAVTSAPVAGAISAPVMATTAAPGAAAAPPVMPGMAFPGMAMPGVSPAVQSAAEASAKELLLAEKKNSFLPKCWDPALTRSPEPKTVKLVFSLNFDPQGREIGRAISEDRTAMREDVAICLRGLTSTLQISPPPGVPVRVDIPLELP